MATTLASQVTSSCIWTIKTTPAGYASAIPAGNSFSFDTGTMANGTAAGQNDTLYGLQITIAGGGNTTINLNSVPTKDPFGNNLVFARVNFFYINLLTTTTASSIAVGNATNPLVNWISVGTSTIKINNGGIFVLGDSGVTGYPVTASTADVLKILNNDGSNTATINVALIGKSA